MYAIVISVIVGSLGLYYLFLKHLNVFKRHGIPHATPLPFIGNMGSSLLRLRSIAEFVKMTYDVDTKAKYIGMYDLMTPIVVIRDLELLKLITLKHFDMFMDHRVFVDENQDKLFSKNLFALRGERWRQIRAVLTPAFTSSKMRAMYKLMSECGADFGNYLMETPPDRRTMELKNMFTRYTNDVIATCAFGVSVDSMRNPNNKFYLYGKEATNFNGIMFFKFFLFRSFPWLARILGLQFFRKKVVEFFQDIIRTTINTRDEKGIVRPDMLQLMMENRNKEGKPELSIDDMVSQAFSFFFGGFDSTSTLMCFAAHEIAVNPGVQEILRSEIDRVLEETNGQATYEAVNNMEYLDAVINETLRIYPIVAAIDRLCTKDSFELPPTLPGAKPFTVKKGQGLWIPIYGFQHDPKYFDEPAKFDPERFLGDRKKDSLGCGAYLPFGLGPRMCIGNRFALLETKALLFHLLARCELNTCEKTPMPLKLAKDGFNMKPQGGFWLNVSPRKSVHHTIKSAGNGTCEL